jgi:hypothetical protein
MPTVFACPCSLKKIGGNEHVLISTQLSSKCHLKELGRGAYVPTLPFYIPIPFKKLGKNRHVRIPLNGKLLLNYLKGIKF